MTVDPLSLHIVCYPDPVLREKAAPLDPFTDEHRAVAERMVELMYDAEGIGLAAPQVGLPLRMFVLDVPFRDDEDDDAPHIDLPENTVLSTDGPVAFINPTLTLDRRAKLVGAEEGCLSLPELTGEVRRPEIVHVEAIGIDGTPFTMTAGGLLGRCIQHENDHLDGVLIIDRMTPMSRLKIRGAVRNMEKAAKHA